MEHRRLYPNPLSRSGFLARTFACIILLFCAVQSFAGATPEALEKEYIDHKKSGDYTGALDILRDWTVGIADPALAEVNVFRIRELIAYPELCDRGLDALGIIKNSAPSGARFLRDRIDIIMGRLILKKGELRSASRVMSGLSYMDFDLMGPFKGDGPDDFDTARCPEQGLDDGRTCTGIHGDEAWFHAVPDRMGVVDIDALNGKAGGSLYYFRRRVSAVKAGYYFLVLGKTGYADIWIDGVKVFSDRSRHAFDHDQYFIPVRLTEGAHRMLIKAGSSADGIKLAARIVEAGADIDGPGHADFFPPALASLLRKQDQGPADRLRAGYLFVESRGRTQESGIADGFLSRVPESHPLFAAACFYRARAADDSLYEKSIATDPGFLEAHYCLALNALRRGLPYEASPHIDMLKKSGHAAAWSEETLALLCEEMGWDEEALRHAAALKNAIMPSAGLRIEADVFRAHGDAFHETQALERLIELDRYNRSLYLSLGDAHERRGDPDAAIQLLQHAAAIFPNDTAIKVRLAALVQGRNGPGAALPYLAAALNAAPGNAALLKATGMAYLNLGKNGPAERYLRKALRRDPGDNTIRLNLEILENDRAGAERRRGAHQSRLNSSR